MEKMFDAKVVASRIKERRIELGYTQKTLAEACDITVDSVKNYENQRRIPETEILKNLSRCLKVQPSWILGISDYKSFGHYWDSITSKEDTNRLRLEVNFYEYCDYLGCTFEPNEEDKAEEFKNQCNKSIKKIYKEIKERA